MARISRRGFLARGVAGLGALGGLGGLGHSLITTRMALAAAGSATVGRFVFIILRGALDGLSAVPPYADPDYAALRGVLALPAPGAAGGTLPLDRLFALHPSLGFLHEC